MALEVKLGSVMGKSSSILPLDGRAAHVITGIEEMIANVVGHAVELGWKREGTASLIFVLVAFDILDGEGVVHVA